jgi:phi13 family phage major tail protein
MDGVLIGLKDLYYALLTSDEVGSITYATPVRIAGAVTADINPNASNETLFADDGPMETASTLGQIGLDLVAADVPLDIQAVLLGHSFLNGVMLRKGADVPPWVAIGFKSLKSNGKYRFVWLVKGKFVTPEQKHATKGDKVAFQNPTLKGNFVKRDGDDVWQKTADEDSTDYVTSIGTNWFTAVEGPADTTPPTVSTTVPADAATGVAVTANMVWNFSEAIQPADVQEDNFFVFKESDGVVVAGALSLNGAGTEVTFNPTASLSATTKYWAVATTSVRDLAGNALAAPKMVSFTTA